MTAKTAEQNPQEKLQEFLEANGLTIGLVMVSKNGSSVTLLDALDLRFTEKDNDGLPIWQPSIVVKNGDNGNG